jgi:tetratricopeptide (TPR) repeat protein
MNMKIMKLFKLCFIATCLLFSSISQAQEQEWEDVTVKFGRWQTGEGLTVSSNSLNNLTVKNTTGEGITDSQGNLSYRSAYLNLNWKEVSPFGISFTLSNKKSNPYTYNQEQVYWGFYIELYGSDGSVVSNTLWLSAERYESESDDGNISRYSFASNNDEWKKWTYLGKYIQDMKIIVFCKDNSLFAGFSYAYYANNETTDTYEGFAEWSNITGIKSIKILVGSGAEVSVKDFTAQRQESTNSSSNTTSRSQQSSSSMSADEYFNQGAFYSNQMNYSQAIVYYKKALEINPNHYWANNNVGYTYYLTEEYSRAIPYLQKAIEIEPDNPYAYSNMGGVYFVLKEYYKAIDYCRKAINLKDRYNENPSNGNYFYYGEPYLYMGLAYAGLNDEKNALAYITEAARLGDEYAKNLLKELEENAKSTQQQKKRSLPQQKTRPSQGGLMKDPNFKIK